MLCAPVLLFGAMRGSVRARKGILTRQTGQLRVLTLSFNQTYDQQLIEHNCEVLRRSGHEFLIYTDDMSREHCSVCKCIPFQRRDCRCPHPERKDCGLCEKLHFVVDRVNEFQEFAFVDSDVVVLDEGFFDKLYRRSLDFDFLASYGFGDPCQRRYKSMFNSGLFFMRRLEGVNYSEMIDLMWTDGTNNDQNIISKFVMDKYGEWDSLSLKWHCRFMEKLLQKGMQGPGIPIQDCYTLHGRGNMFWRRLKEANRTLLSIS